MSNENITLRFKQGSSDKGYKAALLEQENGHYLVNFAYGRYNGPYKTGTKTAKPLPYAQAKLAYDKLVKEKMAKGYTADTSGKPFEGSVVAPDRTNYLPQLLNPIEPEDIPELFTRFKGELGVAIQVKHDGERRIVVANQNEVYGSNRKGLKVALNFQITEVLRTFVTTMSLGQIVLDAEDMGDHLVIFDILEWETSLVDRPFAERAQLLWAIPTDQNVLKVDKPLYVGDPTPVYQYIEYALDGNEEGIVLRDPEAPYTPGRPNSGGPCLKIKFYATATCCVFLQHPTKRSITLSLIDPTTGYWEPVGNCTIPPNYEIPNVGDLVEIKYLYAYRGGSLYQPQYKGVRTDLELSEANFNQLKYKD